MEKIIEDIRAYVHSMWKLGELHGIAHWDRVYENGRKLLDSDVNALVVGLFAYLHDSCRMNDGKDINHGKRAAEWIEELKETYLKNVSEEDIELLKEACRLHTIAHKTGNPTIDACFDADRLDLWRVDIIPDPRKLATKKGKEIARNTDYELCRFLRAQGCASGGYNDALQEVTNGYKRKHWIWYIFPQIKGLGFSYNSEYYGIGSLEEAEAYLGHEVLGNRLREISNALLQVEGKTVVEILGGIDSMKVKSSMTLFDLVSPNDIFAHVLEKYYGGKRCELTLKRFER